MFLLTNSIVFMKTRRATQWWKASARSIFFSVQLLFRANRNACGYVYIQCNIILIYFCLRNLTHYILREFVCYRHPGPRRVWMWGGISSSWDTLADSGDSAHSGDEFQIARKACNVLYKIARKVCLFGTHMFPFGTQKIDIGAEGPFRS